MSEEKKDTPEENPYLASKHIMDMEIARINAQFDDFAKRGFVPLYYSLSEPSLDDLDDITGIQMRGFARANPRISEDVIKASESKIREQLTQEIKASHDPKSSRVLIKIESTHNDHPLGFISMDFDGKVLRIDRIYVDQEHHGKKVGVMLLREAVNRVLHNYKAGDLDKVRKLKMQIHISDQNDFAIERYKRMQAKPVTKQHTELFGIPVVNQVLQWDGLFISSNLLSIDRHSDTESVPGELDQRENNAPKLEN